MEQNRKRSGRGRRTLGALAALAGVLALTLAGVLAGCGAESRQSTRSAPIQPGTQAPQVDGQQLEGRLFFVNSADGSRTTVLNGLEELWSRENTVARPVRDEALGRAGGFAVCPAEGEGRDWTLYDADGELLMHCGSARPESLLNGWALLKEVETARYEANPTLNAGENRWVNLETGAEAWPGCRGILPLSGGEYLLTFLDGSAPARVNEKLEELGRYEGYTGAEASPLAGRVLLTRSEDGKLRRYLSGGEYQDETGRDLPFVRSLGEDLGLFGEAGQYRVLRLSDGQLMEEAGERSYWAWSRDCRLWQEGDVWQLERRQGRAIRGILGGVWGGGLYFQQSSESPILLLDETGATLRSLPVTGMLAAGVFPLGEELLALYYQGGQGGGLRLYRPEGLACALAGQVPVSWQTTPDGWLVASYAGGTARLFDPTGAGAGRVYQSLAPTETAGVLTACLGGERGLVDYRGEWLWQAGA